MNSVTMIGRLTKEPELRRTQSGTACCSFSLAVKRPRVKDTTDFHECVVWQQGAEYLCQYGHKGDIVGVTGFLITRSWEDKDGNKHKAVEVNCDSEELLSSKKNSEGSTQPPQNNNAFHGGYSGPQNAGNPPQYNQTGFGGYNHSSYPAQNYQPPVGGFVPVDDDDATLPF